MKDNFGKEIDPNDPQAGWTLSLFKQFGWYVKTIIYPKSEMRYWGTDWYHYDFIIIMRKLTEEGLMEFIVPIVTKESLVGWLNG
jgi:hypothetical protein